MQNWALMKNSLIKSIDSNSKESVLEMPLKNSLKTLVKISSFETSNTKDLYSKRVAFNIPRSAYDNLAQLYIKCTLSTGLVASTVETYFATKIFKSIILKTKKGTELQTISPEYSQARIDEVFDTELYTHLAVGLEPDVTFLSGSPTCVIPLFFFFSQDPSVFLKTRSLEQLEVELVVNDSKESMGMSVDLTSLSTEIFALFHDTNESNKFDDHLLTVKSGLPKTIKGSFNIFKEDSFVCLTGATSARLLLRCPYPLYVLHMNLVAADTSRALIKTCRITTGGNPLIEFDYRMNYQIYGESKAFVENGTVSLFFSKLKNRSTDSGLITFNKEMFPVYLDITFDALASNFTFNAFEEYRTVFDISETGNIIIPPAELLDQNNSSSAVAFLLG